MKKLVLGFCLIVLVFAVALSGTSNNAVAYVDPVVTETPVPPTQIPPTQIPSTYTPTVTLTAVPTVTPTTTSTALPTNTSTTIPTNAPTSAPVIINELAGGSWTKGLEVPKFFVDGTAPNWLQMLSNPVIMPFAGTTCHDFRGAQFGWIGEIRQLVDGAWVKVDATISQSSPESVFTACVYAPKAGIYTLFGYYSEE